MEFEALSPTVREIETPPGCVSATVDLGSAIRAFVADSRLAPISHLCSGKGPINLGVLKKGRF